MSKAGRTVDECTSCGHRKTLWHESCAQCGTQLTDVFTDGGRQYNGALEVIFSGGYGMFFDNFDGDRTAFLCKDCAVKMWQRLPLDQQPCRPQLTVRHNHRRHA